MPEVELETVAIAFAALAVLVFLVGVRRILRGRIFSASRSAFMAILLISVAFALFVVSSNFRSYARLTQESMVAELAFTQVGPQRFRATLTELAGGDAQSFALDGDDWQLDARVLKWQGVATLLGLDPRYRVERLSGRYRDIEQEHTASRTVYALGAEEPLDLWSIAREHPNWLPFVDALYGSATYLPMAEGARYRVTISPSGLLARPANAEAEQANRAWR